MHVCKTWLCGEPHGLGTGSFRFTSLFKDCFSWQETPTAMKGKREELFLSITCLC